MAIIFQIVHQTSDGPIEFGPAFHKEFLLEVLKLQQLIEAVMKKVISL
jgi:hypothetical protein